MDHPLIELESVDSTNIYAADLLKKKKLAEGLLFLLMNRPPAGDRVTTSGRAKPGKMQPSV